MDEKPTELHSLLLSDDAEHGGDSPGMPLKSRSASEGHTLKSLPSKRFSEKLTKIGIVDIDRLPPDHFSLCYGVIEYYDLRFLITDRPAMSNLNCYLHDLKKYNVRQVIRACASSYPTEIFTQNNILVTDYVFDDGHPPPEHIIRDFLLNIKKQFTEYPGSMVAIHCVAGLGRSPVLVAIALIEAGMNYLDVVEYIRKKRRGAINVKQLDFLQRYKSSMFLKQKKPTKSCVVM